MSYLMSKSTSNRGHIKCHTCRLACPPKEGSWVTGGSDQIFVCKTCKPFYSVNGKVNF